MDNVRILLSTYFLKPKSLLYLNGLAREAGQATDNIAPHTHTRTLYYIYGCVKDSPVNLVEC